MRPARFITPRPPSRNTSSARPPWEAGPALALATKPTLDFESDQFQAWLRKHKLNRHRREIELDFGRRTFLHITRSMKYDYEEKMDRHASHLCEADAADC